MRSFWSDPYLWIHLAGLAAFPVFLEGCLLGFAVGEPFLPVWLELFFVAVVGIAPILWMQWQRPFYIFSLVAITVKAEALTDDQRRLLTLFKLPRNRALAVLVAVALVLLLQQVYDLAPIAAPAASVLSTSHFLGLLLAAIAFLACNLFVQVPVSVASVMLASESAFAAASPYPLETIRRNFTLVGLPLKRILPPVKPDPPPALTKGGKVPTNSAIAITPTTSPQAESPSEPVTQDIWDETTEPISDTLPLSSESEAVATGDAPTKPPETELPESERLPEQESSGQEISEQGAS